MIHQVGIRVSGRGAELDTPVEAVPGSTAALFYLLLLILPMPFPELASLMYLGLIAWCILHFHNGFFNIAQGLRLLIPFLVIFLIGSLQVHRHSAGDVLKDAWYLSLPVLTFMAGWLHAPLMQGRRRYRILLIASLANGGWYLIRLIPVLLKVSMTDRYGYRAEAGTVDFLVVWGMIIALDWATHWWELKSSDKKLTIVVLFINILAIGLSLSRTAYVSVSISFAVIWFSSNLKKRKLLYVGIVGAFSLFIYISGALTRNENTSTGGGIARPLQEIAGQEFTTLSDVNENWRAYEAAQAMGTFIGGSPLQYLIGQGMGTLVDLQIEMDLGTAQQIQYIPIIHNGYMYLLVKSGILGVLLFLWQIRTLWRRTRLQITSMTVPIGSRIGRAILLSTLFSTLVITGPYNKGAWFSAMLILGMVMRDQSLLRERCSKGTEPLLVARALHRG